MITSNDELGAIRLFIIECGVGAGAWNTHGGIARIHLHRGEFAGMGTRAIGAVFCKDDGMVSMSVLTSGILGSGSHNGKLFKGELADPDFFDKFKVELEKLRDAR